jgi:hypothetical protein
LPPSKLGWVYARADESRKVLARHGASSLQIRVEMPRKICKLGQFYLKIGETEVGLQIFAKVFPWETEANLPAYLAR